MENQATQRSITGVFRAATGAAERRVAALLVVGYAGRPGLTPHARVVPFERALLIGRRPPPFTDGAEVWVVRDPRVSSVHARIEESRGGFEIRDLGSTNGTTVDGAPIGDRVPLREGAVLFIGHHAAVFRTMTERELVAIRRELAAPFGPVPLVSPAFVAVSDKLRRLARGAGELLLVGETGVGKEVYANAVHRESGRGGRFVALNCAAIPRELVESELFGFARGAHSQAQQSKPGLVDEADGGTLFLDEIGEMAPELQAKLLRFIQDRLVLPVGSTQLRRVDVRILAATNRLETATSETSGGVRLDLAVRLGAEPLRLPPLRDHLEDVGALAAHFLRGCPRPLDAPALRALCMHGWPGNVRELAKAMYEAKVLSQGAQAIGLEHLPSRVAGARTPGPVIETRGRARPAPSAAELDALLRRHRGNMMRVARELDRPPALIYRWVERFRLDPDAYRER